MSVYRLFCASAPIPLRWTLLVSTGLVVALGQPAADAAESSDDPPNIVLVMADDMGWGQTGYYGHPRLKTPHLDAMAESGMRFDRFYAGAPVCSPTRASVLTGRANDRSGVKQHGYALRRQEQTIAEVLGDAGYTTGHFGKWHLNGIRGPGVPVLADDSHHPGHFGFDQWLSVTNFFDRDPIMSRMGEFETFSGDSSEIVIDEAIAFARSQSRQQRPFFAVVWFGTPHNPFRAHPDDAEPFDDLDPQSREHYGELVAMDRSIGTLRESLRKLGIADNTLVWFCSDNGGLPRIEPETVGGLRGNKGTLFEGGLRVPAIIEWPRRIAAGQVTDTPACTMDIFPTLVDVVGLSRDVFALPQDGISLEGWFDGAPERRERPIPFRYQGKLAWIDNEYKLLANEPGRTSFQLFNLSEDPQETTDLAETEPETLLRLREAALRWNEAVDRSVAGKDYPLGRVRGGEPEPRFWSDMEEYQPFFSQWRKRPEYGGWLERRGK